MTIFLLSVLALLLGPAIYAWGRRRPTTRQMLDGFILVTIAGIVCVYIIPDAIRAGGWPAIGFLAAGLAFPVIVEKTFHRAVDRAHVFIVLLAAVGLVLHAVLDGIALLPAVGAANAKAAANSFDALLDNRLAIGVILHRLPVGMAIWWSVRPSFGTPAAVVSFIVLIAATAAAYFLGAPVVALAAQDGIAWLQAFVAGSLVHVVAFGVDHEHADGDAASRRFVGWGFRAGILIGVFVLFALPYVH